MIDWARIFDIFIGSIEKLSDKAFLDFQKNAGMPTRGIKEDKKFNLLLEMLVQAQDEASGEVRAQLVQSDRQFNVEQRRADNNLRRAYISGAVGFVGTAIATVIAIAKYLEGGEC